MNGRDGSANEIGIHGKKRLVGNGSRFQASFRSTTSFEFVTTGTQRSHVPRCDHNEVEDVLSTAMAMLGRQDQGRLLTFLKERKQDHNTKRHHSKSQTSSLPSLPYSAR